MCVYVILWWTIMYMLGDTITQTSSLNTSVKLYLFDGRTVSEGVFIEVLVFVNSILMTILPSYLINTTISATRVKLSFHVFLTSGLHSSCLWGSSLKSTSPTTFSSFLSLTDFAKDFLSFASIVKSSPCLVISASSSLPERSEIISFAFKSCKQTFDIES